MGTSKKSKAEEAQLASLAKRVLAMPSKPRDEMKVWQKPKRTIGKGRARMGKAKT
jgi:hypothetical protein